MGGRIISRVRQVLAGGTGAAPGFPRDLLASRDGATTIGSPLSVALALEGAKEEIVKDPGEIRRTSFVVGCRELAENILVLGDHRIPVSANPAEAIVLSKELAEKKSFNESARACGLVFEVLARGFGWHEIQKPHASEIEERIDEHCKRKGIENVYGRRGSQKAYGIVEGLVRLVQGGFIVGDELTEYFGRAISCEFFGRARNLFFDGMEMATPSGREFMPLVDSLAAHGTPIDAIRVLACIAAHCRDDESRIASAKHIISAARQTGDNYHSAAIHVIIMDLLAASTSGEVTKELYEAGFRRLNQTYGTARRMERESDAVKEIHDNRRGWTTRRLADGSVRIVPLEYNEC